MGGRQPGALLTGLSIDRAQTDVTQWPHTLPVVAQIAADGLTLSPEVTILIGQNGSGKSTLVEALAAAWGRRVTAFRSDWLQQAAADPSSEDSDLNRSLRLAYTRGGPTGALFCREERLHAQADWFSSRGRWKDRMGGVDVLARSHGEGFLEILAAMVEEPGLYVLDEPESALSFDNCLILLALLADMCAAGSQVVLATDSPVLAALPHARLLQLESNGIKLVQYAGPTWSPPGAPSSTHLNASPATSTTAADLTCRPAPVAV